MILATIFSFLADNSAEIIDKSLVTIRLFAIAFAASVIIGAPIGVVLGHLHKGRFLAINISNVGRALPSLAVIAIGISVLGLGFTNVTVALVILAVPVILTNAYVAVDSVDDELIEAARGMGMSGLQTLFRVELPLAVPLLFAGMRTAALYVMATTPLAAFAGADGTLGDIIANQASYRFEGVVAASLVIAALAFAVDGAFALLQRYVTPARLSGRPEEVKGVAVETT
jgi:osmoprotectant transport system permease protein